MWILRKTQQWILSRQDVGLTPQCIAKGVLPFADYKVENTACREHIHSCGLQRTERRRGNCTKKLFMRINQKRIYFLIHSGCLKSKVPQRHLVFAIPSCCQEGPAALRGRSSPLFQGFQIAKKSWSDRLGSSCRGQSRRWELGRGPAGLASTAGCF